MDFHTLDAELRRLGTSIDSLSIIGAALRLRIDGTATHPEVETRLRSALDVILPSSLNDLDQREIAIALELVALHFKQAAELFENPHRSPAWVVQDPMMLQAQGQGSRQNIRNILAMAEKRPALAATLAGRFLDVGTGVAAMALEAAETCPALHVVGLDILPAALTLARANVAASPHAARIEIREQNVTVLAEANSYTLIWLPLPFLALPIAHAAMDRLVPALSPNGYLVAGFYPLPPNRVQAEIAALRMVRSGGHVWDGAALAQELHDRGLLDVEICPHGRVAHVIGRKPG